MKICARRLNIICKFLHYTIIADNHNKQAQLGVPHSEIVEIDSQLCLESKTVLSVAKAQNYVGGGDTAQNVSQKGGTLHILSEQRDNRGGTPHIKI